MVTAPCLVCGGTGAWSVWHLRNDQYLAELGLPPDAARKVMCRSCGLVYSRPQLDASEIARLYASFRESEVPGTRHLAAKQQLARDDFRWLQGHLGAPGRVLDIGCSEGSFLDLFRQAGWACTGIEPSAYAAFARQHYGLNVHRGVFEAIEVSPASFDLVTALRVLEHVAEPRLVLQRVGTILRPGGRLYLEVPDAWKPRHRLDEFLGAQHLRLFTAGSLTQLLQSAGFGVLVLDATGRGLRAVAGLGKGTSEARTPASDARPHRIDPVRLKSLYIGHRARYFWKTRGRVAAVGVARRAIGPSRLRGIRSWLERR
jgi:SAM-dependent methyltransferase